MRVRSIVPGFLLSCLLFVTSSAANAASAAGPIPPAPELIRLDQELAAAHQAKEQGRLGPEQYREFLIRFRADLDAVKPRDPPVPADAMLHALILSRLGEGDQATAYLGRALEQEPGNADLRVALGQIRYDSGDYAAALMEAEAVLERDPRNYAALALKHSSVGRVAPNPPTRAAAALSSDKSINAPSAPGVDARPSRRRASVGPPPDPAEGNEAPAPERPSPLVPLAEAAGLGLLAYGVSRSRASYESTEGFDEERRPPYGRGQRFVAGAILAALTGAGVYCLGVAALSAAPMAMKQAASFGNQGLKLAQSQTGAINLDAADIGREGKNILSNGSSSAILWNPVMGRGPLNDAIAATFRSRTYTEFVTHDSITLYRVWGGKAGQTGIYWSRTPQATGIKAIIDSALNPSWGNTAVEVSKIKVPPGVRIFEGYAASQGTLVGGGNQVVIIDPINPAWITK